VTDALVAAVPDGPDPVRWAGQQAVVTLPDDIDTSNSGQIREQLMNLIKQGAAVVIADMTGTVSCDPGGADALQRAWQRAAVGGGQLRVVVNARSWAVLEASGLDRLVSIYPSVQTATAAGMPGVIPLAPRPGRWEGQARALPRRRGRGGAGHSGGAMGAGRRAG
jgi:anti-anti-sigma factor